MAIKALSDAVDLRIDLLGDLVHIAAFSLDLVLLSSDIVELLFGGIEVVSHLLKVSLLSEESLGGCSVLIVQDLLPLQVSALGSLEELVTVVLVSYLEMRECIQKSLDLLFTLLHLTIKLISLSLKLFLYLLTLDYIVSLGVMMLSFSTARLVLAN